MMTMIMNWLRRVMGFFPSIFQSYGKDGIQPFVIIFLARTGSNFLASKLDSHPDILCHHEVFNPKCPHRFLSAKEGAVDLDLGTAKDRDSNPWQFINMVFRSPGVLPNGRPNQVKAIGFKMSHVQGWMVFFSLMLNHNVKKVIVRRENLLKTYVSILFALKSREWIDLSGRSNNELSQKVVSKVYVNPVSYMKYVRYRTLFYRSIRFFFKLTLQKVFEIEFKEIADGRKCRELILFLGLNDCVELHSKTQRQAQRALAERIENIDELRLLFNKTRHGEYLEEA